MMIIKYLPIDCLSVDEIQVAAYKMLASLYTLGVDSTLTHERKYLKTEIERNKPNLGSCLGAFSSCFPVAFLEPHLNKHNPYSLLNRIADHSLEAQDIMTRMESSMPTLETILSEVDQFVESEKTYADAPHVVDVILPLLCSYLPFWWAQGPDNLNPSEGEMRKHSINHFELQFELYTFRQLHKYGDQ